MDSYVEWELRRSRLKREYGPVESVDVDLAYRALTAQGVALPPRVRADGDRFWYFAGRHATDEGARAWCEANVIWHGNGVYGPVLVEGGWLYLVDMWPQAERHRAATAG